MNREIWKPIKGYEGIYEVSCMGRIKSLDRCVLVNRVRNKNKQKYERHIKGRIMKQKITWTGYFEINLTKSQNLKSIKSHRIVAQAFIPNKQNNPQVNHKDGNKLNNKIKNLEWMTNTENIRHAYKNNLVHIRVGSEISDLTEEQVLEIRRIHKTKELNQRQIAKKFEVGHNCIWHIVNRTSWKHI